MLLPFRSITARTQGIQACRAALDQGALIACEQDVHVPSLATERQAPVGADPELVAPLDALECPICFNNLERPTRTACQHWFCRCGSNPSRRYYQYCF
jgi:hypothetical protein